ncbi:MAG: helix-turn-helix domain-containing protein [Planctomycetes bacterium]|nr:helix-turn-helix domain-containing protein [Planctomycetota bacterium]
MKRTESTPNDATAQNDSDPLLPLLAVAERYHVSAATVRRWVREGRLQSIKVGKSHLFSVAALADFEDGDG